MSSTRCCCSCGLAVTSVATVVMTASDLWCKPLRCGDISPVHPGRNFPLALLRPVGTSAELTGDTTPERNWNERPPATMKSRHSVRRFTGVTVRRAALADDRSVVVVVEARSVLRYTISWWFSVADAFLRPPPQVGGVTFWPVFVVRLLAE